MALVFVAGPEDTGPIMELAVKSPTLNNLTLVHLSPPTATKQLSEVQRNKGTVLATLSLVQEADGLLRFPYNAVFFSKFHADAFFVLEAHGDDMLMQRINLHTALSAGPDAVKVIKVDRGNIKQVILEIRKAIIALSG